MLGFQEKTSSYVPSVVMIDFSVLPLLEIDWEVTESHRDRKTMAESKAVWIWKRAWTQQGLKRAASHWALQSC